MMDTPEEEGYEDNDILERLIDVARCLADVQYKQSTSRRAMIMPRFSKPVEEVLKKTKPEQFLFGKDCQERSKISRKQMSCSRT